MTLADGPYGVWLGLAALPETADELHDLAAGIESLGYTALWLGGSWGADMTVPQELLAGSSHLVVGTSITNIWRDPPGEVAQAHAGLAADYGDRFVLGVGAGHHTQTQWNNNDYRRPLAHLAQFLDGLDDAVPPVPVQQRALAALGPKALDLAAARSAGALPYLTTPEHTGEARARIGQDLFLAPMQMTVLAADPDRARARARSALKYYLALPNYTNAWLRLGFTETDLDDEGSDRLVDALVAWGDPATVRTRLDQHLTAGADHVCLQPLPTETSTVLDDLREMAGVLF